MDRPEKERAESDRNVLDTPPTERDFVRGILDMALEDANCPPRLFEHVEGRLTGIAASWAGSGGAPYVVPAAKRPRADLAALYQCAAIAVLSERGPGRRLWLTIGAALRGYPLEESTQA